MSAIGVLFLQHPSTGEEIIVRYSCGSYMRGHNNQSTINNLANQLLNQVYDAFNQTLDGKPVGFIDIQTGSLYPPSLFIRNPELAEHKTFIPLADRNTNKPNIANVNKSTNVKPTIKKQNSTSSVTSNSNNNVNASVNTSSASPETKPIYSKSVAVNTSVDYKTASPQIKPTINRIPSNYNTTSITNSINNASTSNSNVGSSKLYQFSDVLYKLFGPARSLRDNEISLLFRQACSVNTNQMNIIQFRYIILQSDQIINSHYYQAELNETLTFEFELFLSRIFQLVDYKHIENINYEQFDYAIKLISSHNNYSRSQHATMLFQILTNKINYNVSVNSKIYTEQIFRLCNLFANFTNNNYNQDSHYKNNYADAGRFIDYLFSIPSIRNSNLNNNNNRELSIGLEKWVMILCENDIIAASLPLWNAISPHMLESVQMNINTYSRNINTSTNNLVSPTFSDSLNYISNVAPIEDSSSESDDNVDEWDEANYKPNNSSVNRSTSNKQTRSPPINSTKPIMNGKTSHHTTHHDKNIYSNLPKVNMDLIESIYSQGVKDEHEATKKQRSKHAKRRHKRKHNHHASPGSGNKNISNKNIDAISPALKAMASANKGSGRGKGRDSITLPTWDNTSETKQYDSRADLRTNALQHARRGSNIIYSSEDESSASETETWLDKLYKNLMHTDGKTNSENKTDGKDNNINSNANSSVPATETMSMEDWEKQTNNSAVKQRSKNRERTLSQTFAPDESQKFKAASIQAVANAESEEDEDEDSEAITEDELDETDTTESVDDTNNINSTSKSKSKSHQKLRNKLDEIVSPISVASIRGNGNSNVNNNNNNNNNLAYNPALYVHNTHENDESDDDEDEDLDNGN